MITASNGNKFLCWYGGIHEVNDASKATKFKTIESCKNACNLLPQQYKDAGYEPTTDDIVANEDEAVKVDDDDAAFDGLVDKVKELEKLVARIKRQGNIASLKLSRCDKQIEDVLHAIEFQQLNVVKGYNAYKRLHELRIIRRKYKDQIFIANSILGGVTKHVQEGTLSKQIAGLDGRKYRVRYEHDLFPDF